MLRLWPQNGIEIVAFGDDDSTRDERSLIIAKVFPNDTPEWCIIETLSTGFNSNGQPGSHTQRIVAPQQSRPPKMVYPIIKGRSRMPRVAHKQ